MQTEIILLIYGLVIVLLSLIIYVLHIIKCVEDENFKEDDDTIYQLALVVIYWPITLLVVIFLLFRFLEKIAISKIRNYLIRRADPALMQDDYVHGYRERLK